MNNRGRSNRWLSRLYHEEYPGLVRLADAFVKDTGLAEDLVQDGFVRLMEHPPDNADKARAWLRVVISRLALDTLRHASVGERTSQQAQLLVLESVVSSEQQALNQIALDHLRTALHRLTERDQRLLLLRHAGYSYREIGRMFGVKTNAVGVLLSRALIRLRAGYHDPEHGTAVPSGEEEERKDERDAHQPLRDAQLS